MTAGLPTKAESLKLTEPSRLFTGDEVLGRPSVVPAESGVYAWYFSVAPPAVPTQGCIRVEGSILLYVGISPRTFTNKVSTQNLRSRLRYHYRGNAEGSTLRLTLGCLLTEDLGIELRRVGSGTRLTFGADGERRLSEWMRAAARVCWVTTGEPHALETELIRTVSLPLNLDQNAKHAFRLQLRGLRIAAAARARLLPPLT